MPEPSSRGSGNPPTFKNFKRITAARAPGGNAILFGLQENGEVCLSNEMPAEKAWTPWDCAPSFAGPGGPKKIEDFVVSAQGNQCLRVWAIDNEGHLWSAQQSGLNERFKDWSRLDFTWEPRIHRGGPPPRQALRRLAAAPDGGAHGARLWAIDLEHQLVTWCQQSPGGNWGGSVVTKPDGTPPLYSDVTVVSHASGLEQVWTLDGGRLLSMWQLQPGGSGLGLSGWTGWPNPPLRWQNAQPLFDVTACEQSGGRGAAVWGVTLDHKLICDYQETPGGEWSGWSTGNWLGAPPVTRLTSTQLSNGAVQLWGLTLNGGWLTTTRQEGAGGSWTEWSAIVNVPPM